MNPIKIIKYGKYFNESRFVGFLGRYGKKLAFVQQAVTLFLCLRDKDTPKYVKAVIAGALGYLVLPVDVVPDTIAVLGWVDDVAFKIANRYIKTSHQEEAKKFFPFGSSR